MKKMKKLIPATMAGAMIFGMGAPAFAADDHVEIEMEVPTDESGGVDAEVPVDGRINRQTVQIVPPTDPDPNEVITARVSTEAVMWWVPSVDGDSYAWNNWRNLDRTDLLGLDSSEYNGYVRWGGSSSFHSGGPVVGQVFSPDYEITNRGSAPLEVNLVSFNDGNRFSTSHNLSGEATKANQVVSGTNEYDMYEHLTLTLLGLTVGEETTHGFELVSAGTDGGAIGTVSGDTQLTEYVSGGDHILDAGYSAYGDMVLNSNGSDLVEVEGGIPFIDGHNIWTFGIGGTYTGSFFEEELQFDHNMVLNFSLGEVNEDLEREIAWAQ